MKLFFISLLSLIALSISSQTNLAAYAIYNGQGESAKYNLMIDDISTADVIFIGEYHNNPISHWLEYEVTKSVYKKKNKQIILGAEMFEADTQLILDEYIGGTISEKRFEDDCRLWPNYKTDYKPLVLLAKDSTLNFIATNVPRRYADYLHRMGDENTLNELSEEAKKYIAPLPIPFKPDSVMQKEAQAMGMMSKNPLALAKAQAIKDATMAYFISKNIKTGKTFIHYNGSYHSNNYDGIIYFLRKYNPNLKIKTLTTVQQDSTELLEYAYHNIADYIICVPTMMTKTY